jgi:hypothetical protein
MIEGSSNPAVIVFAVGALIVAAWFRELKLLWSSWNRDAPKAVGRFPPEFTMP